MILTLTVYALQIFIGMVNLALIHHALGVKFGKELNVFAQLGKILMVQCVLNA